MKNKIFLKILQLKNINKTYVSWLNDYETVKYTDQKYHQHTLESTIVYYKNNQKKNNQIMYAIIVKKNDKNIHIGNIKLGPMNLNHKYSEISYFIGNKKYLNKGIGSEAISEIIKISKTKYKLKKLIAGTYSNNIASQKVLIKNGFKKEARFKSQLIFEKERVDHYWYGLRL